MSSQITRRLKPEEQELIRKREELAALRATLAERELELLDFRGHLAAFEGRYLREVGALYAELDELKARIAELQARLHPSVASQAEAKETREQARQTYEDALQRRRILVAQVFGLADSKTGAPEFNPAFVDRVRSMEFPQLMFLPKQAGIFEIDSLLRLDEVQSVFVPHLEAKQYSLADNVVNILRHQIDFLLTGHGPNDYTELREFLLNDGN
jgi:BMFP domain-containing protein YqiC